MFYNLNLEVTQPHFSVFYWSLGPTLVQSEKQLHKGVNARRQGLLGINLGLATTLYFFSNVKKRFLGAPRRLLFMSVGWNCVMCPYLNQPLMRGFRPLFLAHHSHGSLLGLGSTSSVAQDGTDEEDGHLNKIRVIWKEDGEMEQMLHRQPTLSTILTH